jgi:hypothetical protein
MVLTPTSETVPIVDGEIQLVGNFSLRTSPRPALAKDITYDYRRVRLLDCDLPLVK